MSEKSAQSQTFLIAELHFLERCSLFGLVRRDGCCGIIGPFMSRSEIAVLIGLECVSIHRQCSANLLRKPAFLAHTVRPHSALNNLPPAVYAKISAPGMQRDGALRYVEGSAPRPVAPPSQQGSNEARTFLSGG